MSRKTTIKCDSCGLLYREGTETPKVTEIVRSFEYRRRLDLCYKCAEKIDKAIEKLLNREVEE